MSLPKPNLDDKTFEELVEESKKLIPIYAPEWTDFNVSDPGIIFIELFAWLAEIQMYRMNQVTEKNKLKFLKLLGIKPKPSTASKVNVTFFSSDNNFESVIVPQGTQLTSINFENSENIIFETDYELIVAPLKLSMIISESVGFRDNTDANDYDGHYYYPFGEEVKVDNRLYLGFESQSDNSSFEEITLMINLYEDDLRDRGRHGDEKPEIIPSAKLKWEYCDSDGIWNDLKIKEGTIDETQNFNYNGCISLSVKGININKTTLPPFSESLFWIRCSVKLSSNMTQNLQDIKVLYDFPPRIDSIQLNTVSATQGKTITDEYLGLSNGLPHQKFVLKNKPIIFSESQKVSVQNLNYLEVDDFDASGPEDLHYILDKEKGEISFGDGINGYIPPKDAKIVVNSYRTGGGEIGNVKERTINQIIDFKLTGINVINLNAASGGMEKESLEDAIISLRKDLKEPYQAVTSNDYEYIAKATPGLRIRRVKAIENKKKALMNIIVVPEAIENSKVKPELSESSRVAIYRHLCKHRLITTQIEVNSPEYIQITVTATVRVKQGYNLDNMGQKIEGSLKMFLDPLIGGINGKGWPFGRSVFKSEIYECINNVNGVDCIQQVSMENGEYAGDKINISPNGLVYSERHYIKVLGPEEECKRRQIP